MPTRHQLAAAVQVARWIDAAGNVQEDAHAVYRTTATGRVFPPSSLHAGEGILLAAGLLRLAHGRLTPTPALARFVTANDEDVAVDALARMIAERTTAVANTEAGAAGEDFVLARVRENLEALHRPDLAERCERVSLVSDWFGFDIAAPKITGEVRRLEVKTQSIEERSATARFFLTRNEYDTGRANPTEWALVVCWRARTTGGMTLVGWCRAATLASYLPADQNGRWTEALVHLPVTALTAGLPAAM